MINLNYYKITANSNKENVFKHFNDLENKLTSIVNRYENAYHHGPFYKRFAIFSDKYFDSFCKEEFLYYKITKCKYNINILKNHKWQTKDFIFNINLGKANTSFLNHKYVSYIDIANASEQKKYKLLVIYNDYNTAKIEFERLYQVLIKLPQKDVIEIIFRNEEKRINNMNSIAYGF